jgi:hypothetical protein
LLQAQAAGAAADAAARFGLPVQLLHLGRGTEAGAVGTVATAEGSYMGHAPLKQEAVDPATASLQLPSARGPGGRGLKRIASAPSARGLVFEGSADASVRLDDGGCGEGGPEAARPRRRARSSGRLQQQGLDHEAVAALLQLNSTRWGWVECVPAVSSNSGPSGCTLHAAWAGGALRSHQGAPGGHLPDIVPSQKRDFVCVAS